MCWSWQIHVHKLYVTKSLNTKDTITVFNDIISEWKHYKVNINCLKISTFMRLLDIRFSSKCTEDQTRTELTSDQSPVFHCGQRNSLQGWTVSLSLWLHLLSSLPASAAFRHTAPRRRLPPPQLLEHCSAGERLNTTSVSVNTCTQPTINLDKQGDCARTQSPRFLKQSYLRPRRVLPAAWVTVSMATFLVVRFALTATVAVINLLRLAVCTADFGTVYFQGTISQATLSRALTFTGHVPPACRAINPCQCFQLSEELVLRWLGLMIGPNTD